MNEFSKDGVLEDKTKAFNERLVTLQKRVTMSASSAKVQLVKLGNIYSTHTALDLELVVQGYFQLQWKNLCDRDIRAEVGKEVAEQLKKVESKAKDQAKTVAIVDGDASLGQPFDIGVSGTSSYVYERARESERKRMRENEKFSSCCRLLLIPIPLRPFFLPNSPSPLITPGTKPTELGTKARKGRMATLNRT